MTPALPPSLVIVGCPSMDRLVVRGEERWAPGGAAFITALAACRAGGRVGLVARVPLTLAPEIAAAFGPRGLDRGGLSGVDGPLPSFRIDYDEAYRATYSDIAPGIEVELCADDFPEAWLNEAKLVHVASIGGDAAQQLAFVRALRARGYRGMISAGTFRRLVENQPDTTLQLLEGTDLFFMNREEAALLLPAGPPPNHPGLICVTAGPDGVEVFGGPLAGHHPVATQQVVDATGAGDSFCGAFLAAYLRDEDPILQGSRIAAEVLTDFGCAALLEQVASQVGERVALDPERIELVSSHLSSSAQASSLEFCGFPFPERDDPLALQTLAAATLHQYGFWYADRRGWQEPMYATADGRRFKGSDFIWQAFTRAVSADPSVLDPERMASEPQLIARICADDDGHCPLPDLASHQALHQAYGAALRDQHPGGVAALVEAANNEAEPGAALLQRLAELPGYAEDHLAKKANLLLIILGNRPERFLALKDPESVQPIVDYHLMRGCLRTGCVRVLDPDLARRLTSRSWVDAVEEEAIRQASYQAIEALVKGAGLGVPEVDGFFFVNGRSRCLETEAPQCDLCPLESCCAQETALFQPVFRTTAY